jgi:hypothetical protein
MVRLESSRQATERGGLNVRTGRNGCPAGSTRFRPGRGPFMQRAPSCGLSRRNGGLRSRSTLQAFVIEIGALSLAYVCA